MRIYYIANDCNEPVGGIKVAYQHVELLCELGHDAKIVHQNYPFRCDWFESKAPVAHWHEGAALAYPDVWVVPEGFECPVTQDVLVFNQNHHLTFDPVPPTERFPNVRGTLVVSEESQRYMQYAFPHCPVWVIHNFVDPALFKSGPKKHQICFMPRKGHTFAKQFMGLLRHKGYEGTIVPMDRLKEAEVARIMGESSVYVHFGIQEGESLPILEAVSSGCSVVQFEPLEPEKCCEEVFLGLSGQTQLLGLNACNTRNAVRSTLESLYETIEKKEMAVL